MSKIEKPNYTQIPNVYLDEIMYQSSATENLVLIFIMRKTFGWHKEKDIISYSQIEKATGLSRPTVSKALKGLIEKGLIKAENVRNGIEYSMVFSDESKENELVNKVDQLKVLTSDSKNSLLVKPKTSKNSLHTKESNLNKLSKENSSDIHRIHELYNQNYLQLYEQGKVQSKTVVNNYGATGNRLKTLLKTLSYSQLETIINNAMQDEWLVEKQAYSLLTILSDNQIHKLLNARSEHKLPSTLEGKIMLDL